MRKLNFIVLLVVVFATFFPHRSEAVGGAVVGTFLKVAAGSEGERIIAGMAEKAGVKVATKTAREKLRERWNMEMYEKIKEAEQIGNEYEAQELARMQRLMAQASSSSPELVPAGVNGYSKFVINTAAFLTGADIIYDVYSSIKTAQEEEEMMEVMTDYSDALRAGEIVNSIGGLYYTIETDPRDNSTFAYAWSSLYNMSFYKSDYAYVGQLALFSFQQVGSSIYFVVNINGRVTNYSVSSYLYDLANYINTKLTPTPTIDEVSLPDTVNPLLDPLRVPGTQTISETDPIEIPDTYPSETEIIIPETNDYPEEVIEPWNDPFEETVIDPVVDPVTDPVIDPVIPPEKVPESTQQIDPDSCEKPWDFKNFKTLAHSFTTAFPFSLPWDAYRAFQAIFGGMTTEKPEWTLTVGQMLGDDKGEIKITIPTFFDEWQPFTHTMLLITFDIGMIYALYKLFGGAS